MTRQERDARRLGLICSYIYGDRWQKALARDLKFNERTVRGWLGGRNSITPTVWRKVEARFARKVQQAGRIHALVANQIKSLPVEA